MSVAETVQRIGIDGSVRDLWNLLPENSFFRLDELNAFHTQYPVVVMKMRSLIPGVAPKFSVVGDYHFTKLGLVTCVGVPMAYLLESPQCSVRLRSEYCVLSLRGQHCQQPAKMLIDGNFGMVGDENAVVMFVNNQRWLIKQ